MERSKEIFEKISKSGEFAIDEFILTRRSEELFLDFKRSADNGSGQTLHQTDRENLARAISGFGNSEGGVIVWGVDCSKDKDKADVAHFKFPISNVRRFVSWLEGAVSGCTIPPHTGVQHHSILSKGSEDGFSITYIPKSNYAPHQVAVHGKYQYHYYIRAGSNFEHTPHAVLAGMFGRRPNPNVFHGFTIAPAEVSDATIKISIGFIIRNQGPGWATDLFMTAQVNSSPGDNCKILFEPSDPNNWVGAFSFEMHISMVSKSEIRLPPESQLQPFVMKLRLVPPFSDELSIAGICGCGQSPSFKFSFYNDGTSIKKLCDELIDKYQKGLLTKEDRFDFVKNILNRKNETEL